MVSLLSRAKKLFAKDARLYSDIPGLGGIEAGVAAAKRANPNNWTAPEPSLNEKLLCLERWYHFVKQKQPELILEGEDLLQLEPSGLSPAEMRAWYWGLRGEASHRILVIANSSYSKTAIRQAMEREGLANAAELMDPGTRESYEGVVKYLSD